MALTLKVSLRELYKQADLEGVALRQVYRQAKPYLITLSEPETKGIDKKITDGAIAGIDACLLANTPDYSLFLEKLNKRKFSIAKPILPLSGKVWPE